jgi:hypothetical protein
VDVLILTVATKTRRFNPELAAVAAYIHPAFTLRGSFFRLLEGGLTSVVTSCPFKHTSSPHSG